MNPITDPITDPIYDSSVPILLNQLNRLITTPTQTTVLNVRYRFITDTPNDYIAIFHKVSIDIVRIEVLSLIPNNPIPQLNYRITGGPEEIHPVGTKYPLTISYPKIYLVVPNTTKIQQIPRLICQTWKSSIIPSEFQFTIDAIKQLNPEYTYEFFDDTAARAFIATNYSSLVLKAYDILKVSSYKADLFRYCYLYARGGIYMDMKTVLQAPLHSIIGSSMPLVLSQELLPRAVCNFFMASAANNPLFAYLIRMIVWAIYHKEKGADMWDITGCTAFGRYLNRHLNLDDTTEFTLQRIPHIYKLHNVQDSKNNMSVRTSLNQVIAYKHFSTYYTIEKTEHHHEFAWEMNQIFTETNDLYYEESYFYEEILELDPVICASLLL